MTTLMVKTRYRRIKNYKILNDIKALKWIAYTTCQFYSEFKQ